jgi:hypothetical protein
MKEVTYYRVTESDVDNFSNYGDTIAVIARYDTDSVINLTTGRNYTYGGEQGTKIKDINEFPLLSDEQINLNHYKKLGLL